MFDSSALVEELGEPAESGVAGAEPRLRQLQQRVATGGLGRAESVVGQVTLRVCVNEIESVN